MEISNRIKKRVNLLRSKKYRQKYQQFIIEGQKLCNEFLTQKPELLEFIVLRDDIYLEVNKHETYIADSNEFKKLSGFVNPDGYLLVASIPQNEIIEKEDFILYLDSIRDPGNFGTIIRTADWFGMKQVFCSPDTVEVYNPKIVQASMGSVWRTSVHYLDWQNVRSTFHSHVVFKAEMQGEVYTGAENFNGGKSILIMGNESHGSDIDSKDIRPLSIPRAEGSTAESLNVSIAASILISHYFA